MRLLIINITTILPIEKIKFSNNLGNDIAI